MLTANRLSTLAMHDAHAPILETLLDVHPPLPLRARLRLADADRGPLVALSLATARVCELSWVWSASISALASKLLDALDRGGHDGVAMAAARLAVGRLIELAPATMLVELRAYAEEIDLSHTRWVGYAERVAQAGDGRRGAQASFDELEEADGRLEPDHALDAALIVYLLAPLVSGSGVSVPLHRVADVLELSGDAFAPTIAGLRRSADAAVGSSRRMSDAAEQGEAAA